MNNNGTVVAETGPVNRVANQLPPLNTVADGGEPRPSAGPETRRAATKSDSNGHPVSPPVPTPPPAAGRDGSTGKFAAGNTHGRGNPFARRQAALRNVLLEVVTADKARALGEKLYAAAIAGDWAAAKLLLAYIAGKPGQAPDPDRLDLGEWLLLQENPTEAEILNALIHDVEPATAAKTVRFLRDQRPSDPAAVLAEVLKDGERHAEDLLEEIKAKRRRRK